MRTTSWPPRWRTDIWWKRSWAGAPAPRSTGPSDLRHDRWVALKVLHTALGAALGVERFQREIRTQARLQHPHLLPLFDSGRRPDGSST